MYSLGWPLDCATFVRAQQQQQQQQLNVNATMRLLVVILVLAAVTCMGQTEVLTVESDGVDAVRSVDFAAAMAAEAAVVEKRLQEALQGLRATFEEQQRQTTLILGQQKSHQDSTDKTISSLADEKGQLSSLLTSATASLETVHHSVSALAQRLDAHDSSWQSKWNSREESLAADRESIAATIQTQAETMKSVRKEVEEKLSAADSLATERWNTIQSLLAARIAQTYESLEAQHAQLKDLLSSETQKHDTVLTAAVQPVIDALQITQQQLRDSIQQQQGISARVAALDLLNGRLETQVHQLEQRMESFSAYMYESHREMENRLITRTNKLQKALMLESVKTGARLLRSTLYPMKMAKNPYEEILSDLLAEPPVDITFEEPLLPSLHLEVIKQNRTERKRQRNEELATFLIEEFKSTTRSRLRWAGHSNDTVNRIMSGVERYHDEWLKDIDLHTLPDALLTSEQQVLDARVSLLEFQVLFKDLKIYKLEESIVDLKALANEPMFNLRLPNSLVRMRNKFSTTKQQVLSWIKKKFRRIQSRFATATVSEDDSQTEHSIPSVDISMVDTIVQSEVAPTAMDPTEQAQTLVTPLTEEVNSQPIVQEGGPP